MATTATTAVRRTAITIAVLLTLGVLLAPRAGASGTPPVADAGGPYPISEGEPLPLDGSGSTDLELDVLSYAWDLDADGQYDDAAGREPSVSWATLVDLGFDDQGGPYPIGLEVDDGTSTSTAVSSFTIANTRPTVTILAPDTAAAGALFTIDVDVSDPGDDSVSSWLVTWGDGRVDAVVGAPGAISHTYASAGLTRDITVRVTDEDGTWYTSDAIAPFYDAVDKVGRYTVPTGAKTTNLAGSGGSLNSAHRAAIGPDGLIYVTGNSSATVERYDPADNSHLGTFVASGAGGLSAAKGLGFGPDGNLYVASAGTGQVLRYNGASGAFIDAFVGTGTLTSPGDLAFAPDGDLYVADEADNNIERYDGGAGTPLGVFTSFAPASVPAGLAWGTDGNLYVSLAGVGRVDQVDAITGSVLGPFISSGVTAPAGLRVGPDGALWVADYWTDQIKRFDAATGAALGVRITEPTPAGPRDITFLPDHQVAVRGGLVVNSTGDAGDNNLGDGQCTTGLSNTASQPECTLRAAIEEAEALANPDVIAFAIPPAYLSAPGVYRFTPASPYPMMVTPVILDAATQPGWTGDPIIELDGTAAVGATSGLDLITDDSFIRGFILHSFADEGLEIDGSGGGGGDRNTLLDNWVGFDANLTPRGNLDNGILVTDAAADNLVQGNVIGHNAAAGILLRDAGTDRNTIVDNLVGVGPNGITAMPNGTNGIEILQPADFNRIEDNHIQANSGDGIRVTPDAGSANALVDNRITGNGGLGIDVRGNGVTTNGNATWFNYPVITGATELTGTVSVDFDLDLPAGDYRIEFFQNPSGPDPSGHGEGELPIGWTTVAGHPNGVGSYTATVPGLAGDQLTATATRVFPSGQLGGTSEFAANATITGRNVRVNSTADGPDLTPGDDICSTGGTIAGGVPECTLRAAIEEANLSSLVDRIRFDIPTSDPGFLAGPPAFAIRPMSPLPVITAGVTLDATSQLQYAGEPVIRVIGSNAPAAPAGLTINADNVTVRGLTVHSWDNAGIAITAGSADNSVEDSVISGNAGAGITISGAGASGNRVVGSMLGVDANGTTPRPNGAAGIEILAGAANTQVGGPTASDTNVIAHNLADGVSIAATSGPGNATIRNSIHSNGDLGIDLGNDGVTANNNVDAWLNFPVIISATETGGTITVAGVYDVPDGDYRFDYFLNPSGADGSGHGEGEAFVAATTLSHPGPGPLPFGATFPGSIGDVVTVTLTEQTTGPAYGPTSEFSTAVTVTPPNQPPTVDTGGPYTFDEGEDLELDASGTIDPDGDSLAYDWDLDNDGSYDDATGVSPTVPWATLVGLGFDDDGGPHPIGLRVDDGINGPVTDSTTFDITNAAPTLTVTGAPTIGAGQSYSLSLSATDPGADTITSWTVVWGDGATYVGPGPVATHVYGQPGSTQNITVSASDEDGTFWTGRLLVPGYSSGAIHPYRPTTGTADPTFGSPAAPFEATVGPDGSLYVTDSVSDTVERYDPSSGADLGPFVSAGSGGLDGPSGAAFGPDGHLYVSSLVSNTVERYDGTTGAHLGTFVSTGSGGLSGPGSLLFDPGGDLLVSSRLSNAIHRYDGGTGAPLGPFVTSGSGGLGRPEQMIVSPTGELLVASGTSDQVLRFDLATGAPLGPLVTAGSGGLDAPGGVTVGPDGLLYVTSELTNEVLRYHATTGAFVDGFVTAGAGGLVLPTYPAFDPDHQVVVTPTYQISGTVFEDVDFGGGPGRDLAASGGVGRGGVAVEVYDAGAYVTTVTTAADGRYSFGALDPGPYTVRVVNRSVTSSRTGSDGSEVAVQTFRADGATEALGTGADRVGGEEPQSVDAPANDTTQTLADLQTPPGQFTQSIVTVDASTGDVAAVDFGFNVDTIVNTNDSGQGSLRRFLANANLLDDDVSLAQVGQTAGIETSIFAIPTTDTGYSSSPVGFTVEPASPLPFLGTTMAVDGSTQPEHAVEGRPVVEIVGTTAAGTGLRVTADGTVLRGLAVNRFQRAIGLTGGDGSVVAGNFIGPDVTGLVGEVGNVDGITVAGATNTIIGGTDVTDRNVISGNTRRGVFVDDRNDGPAIVSDGTIVIGNYIGTDAAGAAALPVNGAGIAQQLGVAIVDGERNRVGGALVGEANVISGNRWFGVHLRGPLATANVVQGNIIGLDAAASSPVPNGTDGPTRAAVYILDGPANTIGGVSPDEGNTIASNAFDGVAVAGTTAIDNSILGNAIFANGDLGIDLGLDGVTANDPGDVDTGPNDLLNAPVIDTTTPKGSLVLVTGTLDLPAGAYRVELFANPSGADPTGTGEGEVLVGSAALVHGGTGPEPWGAVYAGSLGDVITATVTADLTIRYGATSEHSTAVTVTSPVSGSARDQSIRRSDVTAYGGLDPAATVAGAAGPALAFDGAADRLVGPALDVTDSSLSMSGWVNLSSMGTDPRVLAKTAAAGNTIYELLVDSGTNQAVARVSIGGVDREVRGGSVGTGAWHHLAASWDGASLELYVDGVVVDSVAATGTLDRDLNTPATVGNIAAGNRGLAGALDQVQVLHAPLTSGAVAAHVANVTDPATFLDVGNQQTSTPNPWTVSSTQSRSGSFALEAPETVATAAAWAVATGIDEPGVVFESWWWVSTDTAVDAAAGTRAGLAPTDEFEAALTSPSGWELRQRQGTGVSQDAPPAGSPTTGSWVKVEMWTDQNGDSRILVDDVEVTPWTPQGAALSSGSVALRSGFLPAVEDWFVDDAQARKLVTPEPFTVLGPLDRN